MVFINRNVFVLFSPPCELIFMCCIESVQRKIYNQQTGLINLGSCPLSLHNRFKVTWVMMVWYFCIYGIVTEMMHPRISRQRDLTLFPVIWIAFVTLFDSSQSVSVLHLAMDHCISRVIFMLCDHRLYCSSL